MVEAAVLSVLHLIRTRLVVQARSTRRPIPLVSFTSSTTLERHQVVT